MRFDAIDIGEVTVDMVGDPSSITLKARLRLHSKSGVLAYVDRIYYLHNNMLDQKEPADEEDRVEWELMRAFAEFAGLLMHHTRTQLNGEENTDDGRDAEPPQPSGLGEPGQL